MTEISVIFTSRGRPVSLQAAITSLRHHASDLAGIGAAP